MSTYCVQLSCVPGIDILLSLVSSGTVSIQSVLEMFAAMAVGAVIPAKTEITMQTSSAQSHRRCLVTFIKYSPSSFFAACACVRRPCITSIAQNPRVGNGKSHGRSVLPV